jgi:hypothetical protein
MWHGLERSYLEDIDVGRKMTLKENFKKKDRQTWTGLIWL